MEVGVGTQGGFISLSAVDDRSRAGSIPATSTILKPEYLHWYSGFFVYKYIMRTPCKNICEIVNEQCVGCNRTLYEVAAWSRLTDTDRDRIMETLNNPRRVQDGLALKNPKRRRNSRSNNES